MKRTRTIFFSALVTVLALGLAVVALMQVNRSRGPTVPPDTPGLYRPSTIPGLPYEHAPGFRGMIAGATVKINSLGFRGPELFGEGETIRIAALGDSVVFGQGVAEAETLPAQLERELRRGPEPSKLQVINAGARGYNSSQYVAELEYKLLPLKPALVILVITEINDPEREPYVPRSEKLERWQSAWWMKLPLAKTLVAGAYSQEISRLFQQHVRELYSPSGREWPLFTADLIRIRDLCEQNHIGLLAVTFPLLADGNVFARERKQLQDALTKLTIEWVDPLPALEKYPASELVVSQSDFHPNPRALFITTVELLAPVMSESLRWRPRPAAPSP